MKSKQYCEKIMLLFGLSTIDELRNVISKSMQERDMRYSGCFESPLSILSRISVEEIGSMN